MQNYLKVRNFLNNEYTWKKLFPSTALDISNSNAILYIFYNVISNFALKSNSFAYVLSIFCACSYYYSSKKLGTNSAVSMHWCLSYNFFLFLCTTKNSFLVKSYAVQTKWIVLLVRIVMKTNPEVE